MVRDTTLKEHRLLSTDEPTADLALIAPHLDVHLEWATEHRLCAGVEAVSDANPTLALWLIHSGMVTVRFPSKDKTSGEDIVLQAGDAVLMATDRKRTITASRDTAWLSAGVTARLFANDATLNMFPRLVRWRPSGAERMQLSLLLEQAASYCHDNVSPHTIRASPFRFRKPESPVDRWVTDGIARGLIALVWKVCHCTETQRPSRLGMIPGSGAPSWLLTVLLYVTNHAATATVSHMAEVAGFSQSQFNRAFRRYTGCTPLSYLNRTRLQNACHLLRTTNGTIEFVARSVGFDSLSHFTRLFAKEFHETPARFRQIQRSVRV